MMERYERQFKRLARIEIPEKRENQSDGIYAEQERLYKLAKEIAWGCYNKVLALKSAQKGIERILKKARKL
jgi:hypothetical protein